MAWNKSPVMMLYNVPAVAAVSLDTEWTHRLLPPCTKEHFSSVASLNISKFPPLAIALCIFFP